MQDGKDEDEEGKKKKKERSGNWIVNVKWLGSYYFLS